MQTWNNRRRPPLNPTPSRRAWARQATRRGSHLEDRRPVARRSAAARGRHGRAGDRPGGERVRALVEHDAKLAELVLSRETLVNAYDGRSTATRSPSSRCSSRSQATCAWCARSRAGLELERSATRSKKIARFASRAAAQGVTTRSWPCRAICGTWANSRSRCSGARCEPWTRPMPRWRAVLTRDRELDAEFATALRQLMSFVMQDHQFLKATLDTVLRSRASSGWAITPRTWRSRCSTCG